MNQINELLESAGIKIEQSIDVGSFNKIIKSQSRGRLKLHAAQSINISGIRAIDDTESAIITIKELLWQIIDALPDGTNKLELLERMVIAMVFEKVGFQNLTAKYLGISNRAMNYKINKTLDLFDLKPCDRTKNKRKLLNE